MLCCVSQPGSDSSTSQPPADTMSASHEGEDLPASHRRYDSSSLIWPVHLKNTNELKSIKGRMITNNTNQRLAASTADFAHVMQPVDASLL